jgi:hypothetical protein
VVGAEEFDWLTADAFHHFQRGFIMSEGTGALYLTLAPPSDGEVKLAAVADAQNYSRGLDARQAMRRMQQELAGWAAPGALLCDSAQALPRLDRAENLAWQDWRGPRLSPKVVLGEGLAAASAWQCVAAVESLRAGMATQALVSVAGCNQQAIGAGFER